MRRQVKRRPAQPGGFRTDQDLAGSRFLLQLGGDMHGRAGYVETCNRIAAAFADADQSGMKAHTKSDRTSCRPDGFSVALDVPGRNTAPFGVILERARPAENGNAAVAGIMHDHAAGALDCIADVCEPMVQKCLSIVRITGCDVAGRTHHIDSEDRDDVALRGRGTTKRHRLVP